MNGFEIRDSKDILESYTHPKYVEDAEGQGVYVMLHKDGKLSWCPSGNQLKLIHDQSPENWLTGPIFIQLSKEDHDRFMTEFNRVCDRF